MIRTVSLPKADVHLTEDDDLFYISMSVDGSEVCTACYMRDKAQRVVIIQLDTPVEHRGNGYATALLERIESLEGAGPIRVISTSHAVGFYNKLGYTEVSPFVFQSSN
jgi:hypothetical protein